MSFPKYPEVKDSGVKWLGKVPAHWEVVKLKRMCHMQSGDFISPSAIEEEGEYPVYGGNGHRGFASSYTHNGLYPIVGRQGALCGNVNYAQGKFWASEHAVVASPDGGVSPVWLGELLRAMDLNQYSITAAQPGLAVEKIKNLFTPKPPLSEQSQIASFLDHETARIDALVEEQQRLIELLKEKRQAVISHAVTKGLDPNVPMKDSGVEWLGEVPAHWEVRKLSSITNKITNGYVGPTRGIFVDDGIPYLQSLHIKNNEIKFTPEYYVSKEWSDSHAKSILMPGDVLVVQTGDIGQVAVVPEGFPEANCHALIIVSAIKELMTGDWLAWVLDSDYGYNSLLSIKTGALHPHLNCGYVKDIYVPVPPIEEQSLTVKYVVEKERKFLNLISEAEKMIGYLKERRSALISAAVTGKIDVRGWQPPEGSTASSEAKQTEMV